MGAENTMREERGFNNPELIYRFKTLKFNYNETLFNNTRIGRRV